MGVSQGSFLNKKGELITVTLQGDGVRDRRKILFGATPILLSLHGKAGDYVPVMYATGTLSLVASYAKEDFSDLFVRNVKEVSVTIAKGDITRGGDYLFCGYVSPHTYNQVNDVPLAIELEIVDYLGAAKLVDYSLALDELSRPVFQVLPIRAILSRVTKLLVGTLLSGSCYAAGTMFFKTVIDGQEVTSKGWDLSQVSEYSFFPEGAQDPYSEEVASGIPGLTIFPREKITCYDVLAKIAGSVLFSLVLQYTKIETGEDGETEAYCRFVFFDPVAHRATSTVGYGSNDIPQGKTINLSDVIALSEQEKSSVEKYGMVTLSLPYEERSRLLPNLLDPSLLLFPNPPINSYPQVEEGSTLWQECYGTPIAFTGYNTPSVDIGRVEAYREEKTEGAWKLSPTEPFAVDGWNAALSFLRDAYVTTWNTLLFGGGQIGVVGGKGRGLYIALDAGYCEGLHYSPLGREPLKNEKISREGCAISLKVNGKFYNPLYSGSDPKWYESLLPNDVCTVLGKSGNFSSDFFFTRRKPDGSYEDRPGYYVAVYNLWDDVNNMPVSGPVEIEIGSRLVSTGISHTLYLKSLEVGQCASGSDYARYSRAMTENRRTLYVDNNNSRAYSYELPLCWSPCASRVAVGSYLYAEELKRFVPFERQKSDRAPHTVDYEYRIGDEAYGGAIERLEKLVNGGAAYCTSFAYDESCNEEIDIFTSFAIEGYTGNAVVCEWEHDVYNCIKRVTVL